MSLEENKAIARKFYVDVFNRGHVELLNELYVPAGPAPHGVTPSDFSDFVLWRQKTSPGWKLTILDLVAEGEKVVVYHQVDLTYSVMPDPPPAWPMPPFGKPVSWKAISILRIVDGKIVSLEPVNEWVEMLVNEGVYVLAQP